VPPADLPQSSWAAFPGKPTHSVRRSQWAWGPVGDDGVEVLRRPDADPRAALGAERLALTATPRARVQRAQGGYLEGTVASAPGGSRHTRTKRMSRF
jgi:hypothetical protein